MSNGHLGEWAHLLFAVLTSSLFGEFNMVTSIIWIQVSLIMLMVLISTSLHWIYGTLWW